MAFVARVNGLDGGNRMWFLQLALPVITVFRELAWQRGEDLSSWAQKAVRCESLVRSLLSFEVASSALPLILSAKKSWQTAGSGMLQLSRVGVFAVCVISALGELASKFSLIPLASRRWGVREVRAAQALNALCELRALWHQRLAPARPVFFVSAVKAGAYLAAGLLELGPELMGRQPSWVKPACVVVALLLERVEEGLRTK